jgi:hypothetical protein
MKRAKSSIVGTMFALAFAFVVGSADPHTRLVILDLESNAVDAGLTKTISDEVAVALTSAHLADDVTSAADLRAQLGLEAEKRAAGCEANASCIAEIAQALGADLVVHGSVGKIADVYAVTLSLFDAKANRAIAREKFETSKPALIGKRVELASQNLALAYRGHATIPIPSDDEAGASTGLLLTGAGVGVVGAGTAAVAGYFAESAATTLSTATTTKQAKNQAVQLEVPMQVAAIVGASAAVAGVGLVAAAFVGGGT